MANAIIVNTKDHNICINLISRYIAQTVLLLSLNKPVLVATYVPKFCMSIITTNSILMKHMDP